MIEKRVKIEAPFIRLNALLKYAGASDTGGGAKRLIQSGAVKVNGVVCAQRGKKLTDGDRVEIAGDERIFSVTNNEGS